MNPTTEYVTLSVSDGTSMRAYVARPQGSPRAGMLVFQEAFGVNPHIRNLTERFAREGYLAIAPELFHRSGAGFEGDYCAFEAVMPHMKALTDAGMAADSEAAFNWLKKASGNLPVGAIGYCMGGRVAFLADATLPLNCAVSYYGGGIAPNPFFPGGLLNRVNDLKAPIMFFWAGQDQHITPDQAQAVTDAMRAAKKSYVNVEFSEADHGFFCDARASYNAAAAAQAWPLTLAFLNTHLASAARKADA